MYAFDRSVRTNAVKNNSSSSATGALKHDSTDTGVNPDRAVVDSRLRKLLELIENDPRGNIHTWAATFNLSNSHLQRLFKQATGTALGQALTEKRLQKAAQLLVNTNLSIKEIASAVGYEHTSSFTRAFERRFEDAPRSYRTRNVA